VIILDTNVISELTRRAPEPGVISWLDSWPAAEIATTAITAAELLYGVARLPSGHRKAELAAAVHGLLADDFRSRVLPFDDRAAPQYADIVSGRDKLGRPIGVADAQIAAICRALDAELATRNTDDFEDTGIGLVNPWKLGDLGPGSAGLAAPDREEQA
jgi:predicted nucleic acid-binding protein